eukprot:GEMP01012299.1.p1 GENE.GEMP01012299.1~~GEMP01012299.1.p1  ORF type:complete len:498 (+),score=96.95 GEMP01012299.1:122-1615(+)
MPREVITIQVGQCGNQVGCRFWELALCEHGMQRKQSSSPIFDESLSSFFRNVDTRYKDFKDLPCDGSTPIRTLKARAVLVDMEQGVVNSLLRGPLRDIFDHRQLITDVSGAGNNWAHGHEVYGPKYAEALSETIRRTAEACDSLQCFLLLHSLGGGTGSGVGSYILEMLEDQFPEVFRFVSCVAPAKEDDVITSPYNAMLSFRSLINSAHCVLPASNDALIGMCNRMDSQLQGKGNKVEPRNANVMSDKKPFDRMNSIVAEVLSHLTASMRFEGSLNLDLNEITMNLVPYPKMHFLLSSLSPLHVTKDVGALTRSFDQMFTDALSPDNHLVNVDPRGSIYMSTAFLVRAKAGAFGVADIIRNVTRIKQHVRMLPFNEDSFKISLCHSVPAGTPYSVLSLGNSCAMRGLFSQTTQGFMRLYTKKAHIHHYTQFMEKSMFDDALEEVRDLCESYKEIEQHRLPKSVLVEDQSTLTWPGYLFAPSAEGFKRRFERIQPMI